MTPPVTRVRRSRLVLAMLPALVLLGACASPATATLTPPPSVGLGVDRDLWEQTHTRGPDYLHFATYDDDAYHAGYTGNRISYLEIRFSNPQPDPEEAVARATTYLPTDAALVETYSPEAVPELTVYLYASDYLKERFPADAFRQAAPGEFIAVFPVFDGVVPYVILGLGNTP